MHTAPPYTLTNESVTIIWQGQPRTVQRGTPNFVGLRTAILNEDWASVPGHLTPAISIKTWAKGRFSVDDDIITYDGQRLPADLNQRIIQMATRGEDPTCLFNFWERLQRNPSMRSVTQLYTFLQHEGIPITPDGTFLAYKGVTTDLKDCHSRTFDNSPGNVHEMPRNKISDDPNEACHVGFHVGALEYALGFGARVVICEVDPEHVVCVPYDAHAQKMRVCKYKVIGFYGSQLPSTTFRSDVSFDDSHSDDEDRDEDLDDDFSCMQCGDDPCSCYEDDECDDVCTIAAPSAPSIKIEQVEDFSRYAGKDWVELMKETLDDLRRYASKGLKIVGAWKMPGGKVALVSKIIEVRGN